MSMYNLMSRRRYLAPWRRGGLDEKALASEGEEALKALAALKGKPAIYHCVSRVVGRGFLFQAEEREEFVRLMRRYEEFSQVRVLSFCVMSNHFHILVEIPDGPEDGGASWSDDRLLEHLELIYGPAKMAELRSELERYRRQNNDAAADAFRAKFFARMWDLSQYMKILKQCFTQWFNRKHDRRGVLWEERFNSELVEEGRATRRVASYIDLNPVRAGIVEDPKDYRWSSYGEAVMGGKAAREGLRLVLFEDASTRMGKERAAREVAEWSEVMQQYRIVLFTDGERQPIDEVKGRAGISAQRVQEVLESGGMLSETEWAWCTSRYYVDGLVMGTSRFVNQVF